MSSLDPSVAPTISWSLEPRCWSGWPPRRALRAGLAPRPRHRSAHPPGCGRLALFAAGLLMILVALVSPIDALGDQLLVMHMVQHMLLLDIVPICLILGLNKVLLRPVTRKLTAHRAPRRLPRPPGVRGAAVRRLHVGLAHPGDVRRGAAQHRRPRVRARSASSTAGTLYWWHLLSPIRSRMRLGGLGPVAYMVVDQAAGRDPGDRAGLRAGRRSTPSTSTIPTTGACRRRRISRWPGW